MVSQCAGGLANQLVDARARTVHRLQDRAEQHPIAFSFENQQAPAEDQLECPGLKSRKLKFHGSLSAIEADCSTKRLRRIEDATQQEKQSK